MRLGKSAINAISHVSGDDEARVYETWHALGASDLLDRKEHSAACDDMRWLIENPPLQRPSMQLIRIVLGYEGAPAETEDVRRYQRESLGRVDGDTLLIELSAVDARNLSVPVREREHHRAECVATIRRRMEENHPRFVVFYGIGYREEYAEVAGGLFDDGYRFSGSTLCALVRHLQRARPCRRRGVPRRGRRCERCRPSGVIAGCERWGYWAAPYIPSGKNPKEKV